MRTYCIPFAVRFRVPSELNSKLDLPSYGRWEVRKSRVDSHAVLHGIRPVPGCDQRGTKKGCSGAGASSLIAKFQVTGLGTVAYKSDFMTKRPSSEGDSMKLRTALAIRKMREWESRVMWPMCCWWLRPTVKSWEEENAGGVVRFEAKIRREKILGYGPHPVQQSPTQCRQMISITNQKNTSPAALSMRASDFLNF